MDNVWSKKTAVDSISGCETSRGMRLVESLEVRLRV